MTRIFDEFSTADEVLADRDLSGKRIVVTGVSAGLGVETARALVARGAHVIGTARDLGKAETACIVVRQAAATGGGQLTLVELDLADLASVASASDQLLDMRQPFDAIIANAGVMACPFEHTADGHERQFGTNVLGHYALIARLAPSIQDGGRIVLLSSSGHRYAAFDLEDPNFERSPYDPWVAYGRSKTGDVLLAVAFDTALRGRGIRAVAVHPGGINTELSRHLAGGELAARLAAINAQLASQGKPPFRMKSIAQGTATTAWALIAPPNEVGGRYCEDCHVASVVTDEPSRERIGVGVRPYALDPGTADALTLLCARLSGVMLDTTR